MKAGCIIFPVNVLFCTALLTCHATGVCTTGFTNLYNLGFALLGFATTSVLGFHTTGFHTNEFVQPGQQFEALFLLMNRNSQWWLLLMFCKMTLMKLLRRNLQKKVENVMLFLPFFKLYFLS